MSDSATQSMKGKFCHLVAPLMQVESRRKSYLSIGIENFPVIGMENFPPGLVG
jgi:hypothetical protein